MFLVNKKFKQFIVGTILRFAAYCKQVVCINYATAWWFIKYIYIYLQ